MNPAAATALVWASYLGAGFAVIVYFAVLLRRPQWVRLLNGSGLFFSGVALSQTPALLNRPEMFDGAAFSLVILTLMLFCAVAAQATAALRNRQAWDGVDRRTALPSATAAESDPDERRDRSDRRDASDRRGPDRRSGQPDAYWDRSDRREGARRDDADRRDRSDRRGAASPGDDR